MRELVRYIHLNPLRAKVVSSLSALDTFEYSGHSALLGKRARAWQETKYVLDHFGRTVREARRSYRRYVEDGADQRRRPELVGGGLIRSLGRWEAFKEKPKEGHVNGDQTILGQGELVVTAVLEEANDKYERYYELSGEAW